MPDHPSKTAEAIHQITNEIDNLTEQQSEAIQMAALGGMTADEAKEYQNRRSKILQYVKELRVLEESQ